MNTYQIYNQSELIFTIQASSEIEAWKWLAETKHLTIDKAKALYKMIRTDNN